MSLKGEDTLLEVSPTDRVDTLRKKIKHIFANQLQGYDAPSLVLRNSVGVLRTNELIGEALGWPPQGIVVELPEIKLIPGLPLLVVATVSSDLLCFSGGQGQNARNHCSGFRCCCKPRTSLLSQTG